MRINKRASLPILVLIVITVVTTVLALRVRTQSIPAENKQQQNDAAEFEQRFPIAEYEEAEITDPAKRARRMAKNQRYDRRRLVKSKPDKSILATTRVSDWEVGLPAIPSARSHTVVLGEVLDAQAHLSNDKSGVYSEFNVRVVRVFKNLSDSLSPGDTITVEREGGHVRYANDYKRLYRIQGQGMPLQGRKYVFFLSSVESSTDYRIITGYELWGGKVTPLDDSEQFAVYNNRDEITFLRIVEESLKQPEEQEAMR